jgi:hypothetical protein
VISSQALSLTEEDRFTLREVQAITEWGAGSWVVTPVRLPKTAGIVLVRAFAAI